MLVPIMFATYVNDIDEGVDSYMSFCYNANLLRRVCAEGECRKPQQHLNKFWERSQKSGDGF